MVGQTFDSTNSFFICQQKLVTACGECLRIIICYTEGKVLRRAFHRCVKVGLSFKGEVTVRFGFGVSGWKSGGCTKSGRVTRTEVP